MHLISSSACVILFSYHNANTPMLFRPPQTTLTVYEVKQGFTKVRFVFLNFAQSMDCGYC